MLLLKVYLIVEKALECIWTMQLNVYIIAESVPYDGLW